MSDVKASPAKATNKAKKTIIIKKRASKKCRVESNKSVWDLANSKKRCFVCTKLLTGNPSLLLKATTKNTNQTFATCLREIADDKFSVNISMDDRCCSECASLIQTRDRLTKELELASQTLFTYLKTSSTIRTMGLDKQSQNNNISANVVDSFSISVNQENQTAEKAILTNTQTLYQCQVCQNLFASVKDVSGHNCRGKPAPNFTLDPTKPPSKRDYKCKKCKSTYTTLLALYAHEKTHLQKEQPPKYVECKKCKLLLPSKEKLKEHYTTHNNILCIGCGKTFKTKEDLKKHFAVTAKLQPDFCVTCNKIFSSKSLLDIHMQEAHSQSDPNTHVALRVVYVCNCCDKDLPDIKSFAEHKAGHTTVQVYDDDGNDVLVLESDEEEPQDIKPEVTALTSSLEKKSPTANNKSSPQKTPISVTISDHSYSMAGSDTNEVSDPNDLDVSAEEPATCENKVDKIPSPKKPEAKACVYECGMCDVRATSVQNLLDHFQTHKDKPIQCKHCTITMPSVAALSKHLQYHVKTSQGIECLVCRSPLHSKDQLMKHMADLHKMKHQCQICSEQFRYMTELANHKNLHPETRQFMCLFCDERFINGNQLEKHQVLHREPKCSICGKEILDRRKLREHELRHKKALVPCPKCERIFKTPGGLINHMPIHTGVYRYKCETCGKGYTNRKVFEEHVNNHLEHPQMLYKCRYCDKEFSYQGSHWIHEKWHQNPFPYQCKLCGKKLRHASILQNHLRKHRGERPYKCAHCPLTFSNSGTFKRHMMLHTGKYAYNCEMCQKGFTTKQKYHQHQYAQHGIPIPEKPKHVEYKISLGIPSTSNATTTFDEDALAYIVGDFVQPMEVVADEHQQAVTTLTLLDEHAWTTNS